MAPLSTGESEVSRKLPDQLFLELPARRVQQGLRTPSSPAVPAGMDMEGLPCPLSHTKSPRMPSPGSLEPTGFLQCEHAGHSLLVLLGCTE